MREFYAERDSYDGCCAIEIIHDFENGDIHSVGKPLTDDEWFNILCYDDTEYVDGYPYAIRSTSKLNAIMTFAHASSQTGKFTPKKFAEWLISKGEDVMAGPTAINRPRHKITPYFWKPSKTFRRNLTKFCERYNKNKKEEAQNARIARGAIAA